MISSVIARFDPAATDLANLIEQISQHPGIEIGELIRKDSLPLTIEASDCVEMETKTRWIQSQPNVAFVDVVYVHLEH